MVSWVQLNFILFAATLISVLWFNFNYMKLNMSNSLTQPIKIVKRIIVNNPILMDLKDFNYTINNDPCFDNNIFLIIVIHSAPDNDFKRDLIRSTWGMNKNLCGKKLRLVFLIGKVLDLDKQEDILTENLFYGDIVQGNFIDSYKNLTYKNIMGKKWISEYCPNAKIVLKSDDDIYVDIFKLFSLLTTFYQNHTTEFIACYQWRGNMLVIRDPLSEWFVSEKLYPGEYFSPYCSGSAYIFTPDVAFKIYEISGIFNYLSVDDFLVTGLMVDHIGFKRTELNHLYTFDYEGLYSWLNSSVIEPCEYMIACYDDDYDLARKLWDKTLRSWSPQMIDLCYL